MKIELSLHPESCSILVNSFSQAASTITVIQMLQKQLVALEMQDAALKFEDNSMQNSLKVTSFPTDYLPVQRKSNLTKGLIAVVVILPQALALAAASGIEAKGELYTTVVAGTFLTALAIARSLQGTYLKKTSKARAA